MVGFLDVSPKIQLEETKIDTNEWVVDIECRALIWICISDHFVSGEFDEKCSSLYV